MSTFPPRVAFLIVDDTAVPVATREDAEVKQELAVTTPCESPLEPGFTEEAKERMVDKMKSIKGFDAYDEIPNEHCRRDYLAMLSVALVGSRGTPCKVRCRLVSRGCFQQGRDTDDTIASTPTLVTLRVIVLLSLPKCQTVITCDLSTAFLRAPMAEFHPENNQLALAIQASNVWAEATPCSPIHFAKATAHWNLNTARLSQTFTGTFLNMDRIRAFAFSLSNFQRRYFRRLKVN